MHWVIQKGVLREVNLRALVAALERAGSPHSIVAVPVGELRLVPECNPTGPVMVSGAVSMARIARERGWSPGSFLNENFDFERWSEALGSELLNADAEVVKVRELAIESDTFVRPQADTKDFDGQVFDPHSFEVWKEQNDSLLDLEVIAASAQDIYREYRMFMMDDDVITASQYMQAGRPLASPDVDPEAMAYATRIARQWRPAEAFVLDIALTRDGYRVVEFNNINGCGFYASDVDHFVAAIERRFGEDDLTRADLH